MHALWLLVLLPLIAPPVFEFGLMPRWEYASIPQAQRSAARKLEAPLQSASSQGTEVLAQAVEQSVPRGKLEEKGTISNLRDLAAAYAQLSCCWNPPASRSKRNITRIPRSRCTPRTHHTYSG